MSTRERPAASSVLQVSSPFDHQAPGPTETSSSANLWADRCWRSQPGESWPPGRTLAAPAHWPSSPGWSPPGRSGPPLHRSSAASVKECWLKHKTHPNIIISVLFVYYFIFTGYKIIFCYSHHLFNYNLPLLYYLIVVFKFLWTDICLDCIHFKVI